MSIYNDYLSPSQPATITASQDTTPSGSAFDALDLNQAARQLQPQPIIPSGTPVKVMLDIKPGSYGGGGWLTRSQRTSTIYLNVKLTVIEGEYKNRVIYDRIGIQGTKVDTHGQDIWGSMGRSKLRAILESAYNIPPHDESDSAKERRRLNDFSTLNGLVFAIKVGKENSQGNADTVYNNVNQIITPDMSRYSSVMASDSPQDHHDVAIEDPTSGDDFFEDDSQPDPQPDTTQEKGLGV